MWSFPRLVNGMTVDLNAYLPASKLPVVFPGHTPDRSHSISPALIPCTIPIVLHEDLPGCPARKSGEKWQPVAKRRKIPSWFTKIPAWKGGVLYYRSEVESNR